VCKPPNMENGRPRVILGLAWPLQAMIIEALVADARSFRPDLADLVPDVFDG
jgi:hypothetical protein